MYFTDRVISGLFKYKVLYFNNLYLYFCILQVPFEFLSKQNVREFLLKDLAKAGIGNKMDEKLYNISLKLEPRAANLSEIKE